VGENFKSKKKSSGDGKTESIQVREWGKKSKVNAVRGSTQTVVKNSKRGATLGEKAGIYKVTQRGVEEPFRLKNVGENRVTEERGGTVDKDVGGNFLRSFRKVVREPGMWETGRRLRSLEGKKMPEHKKFPYSSIMSWPWDYPKKMQKKMIERENGEREEKCTDVRY